MRTGTKTATFAIGFALAIGASGFAVGEEEPRKKPWEAVDLGGDAGSVGGNINQEKSTGDVSGGTLSSTWEGIESNPSYEIFTQQIDNNEEILMDLESRISALEGGSPQGDNWVLQPPTQDTSATVSAGNKQTTLWDPPVADQESNFTQTRSVSESKSFPMEVYEYNTTTGERRLVDSYTEEKDRNYVESRTVRVLQSSWENETRTKTTTYTIWGNTYTVEEEVDNYYDCTGWLPAPETQPAGSYYYATDTCKINQTRETTYSVSSGTYTWETLKTETESRVATDVKENPYMMGTMPVAPEPPECINDYRSPGHFLTHSASFGIATMEWQDSGIYQFSGVPWYGTPASQEYPLQWGGYDYWGKNYGSAGYQSTGYVCRLPSTQNDKRIEGTPGSRM